MIVVWGRDMYAVYAWGLKLTLLHSEKDRTRVSCLLEELSDSRQKLVGESDKE